MKSLLSKNKCNVLMLFLLLPLTVIAGPIDEAEAQQRAKAFLKQHGISKSIEAIHTTVRGRRAPGKSTVTTTPAYYIFNVGTSDGFVIVSGDDRTVDIIGYSDSGSFDEVSMPDGLRYMLNGYAEQIDWLDRNGVEENTQSKVMRKTAPSYTAISPLISTQWNQSAPYNNFCPEIDNEKPMTGCVATAMAQVMYYHKLPTGSCTAIPGYSCTTQNKANENITLNVDALDATTFQWGSMSDTYTSTDTGAAADAVAELMKYCGVASHMYYGLQSNGGSSSYGEIIPSALKTYFGYDGGVRNTYRENYNYDEWVNLIYSELESHRPVILGGQSAGGGHAFVCDGYNENDYFHINWGWSGKWDGYFRLSLLNPWENGIGKSSTLDGFSCSQSAIIGIQEPVPDNKDYCMSLEGLHFKSPDQTTASKTYERNSEGNFTGIEIYYLIFNYNVGNNSFDSEIQLVDGDDKMVLRFPVFENNEMNWNDKREPECSLTIPSSVADGTYYIKVMSRPYGTTEWQECFDGDRFKLKAVISNNILTITVPITETVVPTSATMTVNGNKAIENEQEVEVSITGSTTTEYHDNVKLYVNNKFVMGKMIDIQPGETVNATYSFIPKITGENTLKLISNKGTQIGSSVTVNIHVALNSTKDNSKIISECDKVKTNVTLENRTLYKDGQWNTLYLPFDVDIANSPLSGDGVTAMTLNTTTSGVSGSTLTLNFDAAPATIPAGTPFIIKWDNTGVHLTETDLVFNNVTISNAKNYSDFTGGSFRGTYASRIFTGEDESILFLGTANKLYYPLANAKIGACRAFFKLIDASVNVKEFNLNFDDSETPLLSPEGEDNGASPRGGLEGAIYDLSGRLVNLSTRQLVNSLKKGIYIKNGKKILF